MREAKKGKCDKCSQFFFVDAHHILPKSKFGKTKETADLCPNCHRLVHDDMKKEISDNSNAE